MIRKNFLMALVILGFLAGLVVWNHRGLVQSIFNRGSRIADTSHIKIDIASLKKVKNLIPVAVIGSGPAGLSAALYTARMNCSTVVFKGDMPGGQLMGTSMVENWPGVGNMQGPDIMKNMEKHVERFGVQFSTDSIEKVDFTQWPYVLTTDEKKDVRAMTVIITTGSTPKRLGAKGEQEYWGRGVSTCAVCDAPFYKDREVAVIGGGDSATEAALQLAVESKRVTMLVRGETLRASSVMQQRVREYPNISIRFNTQLKEVRGNDSHVTHVDVVDKQGVETSLAVDGLFLAIGYTPNAKIFKGQIALDSHGYVALTPGTQDTSRPGIFAAGDVADFRYRQAGVAAGDGIKAGLDTINFLREHGLNEAVDKQLEHRYFDVEHETVKVMVPIITSKSSYEVEIKNEKRPIILDFYAPYCSGCMRMVPMFESAAAKFEKELKFIKVDVSQSKELSNMFDVPMIPTLLVIQDGKVLSRSTETMSKRQLHQYIQRFVTPQK